MLILMSSTLANQHASIYGQINKGVNMAKILLYIIFGVGFVWGAWLIIDSIWINPDNYSPGDELESPASWSSGIYSD